MKTVFLLRHAKSSWSQPHLDDYQRPLAPRGVRDAPRMGRFMAREGLIPERVLCSGATRAQESWALVSGGFGRDIPVQILPTIYHGSPETLRGLIHGLPSQEDSVLIVGHNPTLHDLALSLAGSGREGPLRRLQAKYPTGALAILDFRVESWTHVEEGEGILRGFVRPKALKPE